MSVDLLQAPFSPVFLSEFIETAKRVFGHDADSDWFGSLKWRLENMPDATVFTATKEARLAGFKAGYAIAEDRYYSWLGGVDPDFRGRGIAKELMSRQHQWLSESRFRLLETHVEQGNERMIQLNLDGGLSVVGLFLKDGKPYFMMQKKLRV